MREIIDPHHHLWGPDFADGAAGSYLIEDLHGDTSTVPGLVGTVFGLITAFAAISGQNLSQAEKQQLLTGGIAEAMYNTFFGLAIAVVCMICHVILHSKSKNIVHDLESTTERVFNLLTITKGS